MFKDKVKKALVIKVLNYLDDIRMVQVLQYLHLLESSKKTQLLWDCLYLADSIHFAVPLKNLADDGIASAEDSWEVIETEDVSPLTLDEFVDFEIVILWAASALCLRISESIVDKWWITTHSSTIQYRKYQ